MGLIGSSDMENIIKRAKNRLTPPAYKLTVGEIEAGSILIERLISLSVTSNGGGSSDQLSLIIDAKPGLDGKPLELPVADGTTKIKLWLGYQLRLIEMGIFYVDQVSLSGSSSGFTLTVSAIPKAMNNQFSEHWASKGIDEIVTKIAKRHKLEACIDEKLKSELIQNIEQKKESDLNFLTHLAVNYDAVVKPIADKLIFLKKGQGTSASGELLAPIHLFTHDLIQWDFKKGQREEKYTQVQACYWNYMEAQLEIVHAGDEGVLCILDDVFNNAEIAMQAAQAKLNKIQRSSDTLSLTVLGDPELTAEATIKLKGLHKKIDGDWRIQSATHSYSSSGYQCQLQAYRAPE